MLKDPSVTVFLTISENARLRAALLRTKLLLEHGQTKEAVEFISKTLELSDMVCQLEDELKSYVESQDATLEG